MHCAVIGTDQKLTWPYLDFSNGDEIRKGSARPGSYKLVRPVGNGIPLSEVYRIRVSLLWPASCNSCKISPIPRNTQNEILVLWPEFFYGIFFFRLRVRGTKKNNKKALKMTS